MTTMPEPTLASPSNPRIKAASGLRDRRERDASGLTLVDGARELRRALDAGVEILEVFICEPLLAGQDARARRVAWTGAAMAAGVTEAIGLSAALFPHVWLALFSAEPEVLRTGATYLRIVGPTYGFFGLGLALYFASQGAGRLLWPLVAGLSRLVVAAGGGWIALRVLGGGLSSIFAVMALALVLFGTVVTVALHRGAWRLQRTP